MKRILFVDDEHNFLDGIRRMLRHERALWDMDFVDSGEAALEAVAGVQYDAIVSDVSMPHMSGLELLERLTVQGVTNYTPVIILTGNAETDLKRRALDLGAADLLGKPVVHEDLVARLRSVIRLKEVQDALRAHNELLEQRVRERTRELEQSRRDILWRLAKAGEFRDVETGEHVIRVACCSRILAVAAGLDSDEVERIFLTAPLHDIGKIGVPDGILLKPGQLSPMERSIMERHCEIGASILLEEPRGIEEFLSSPFDPADDPSQHTDPLRAMAVQIVLNHHERWDGGGYPNRRSGDAIPVAGRIVALADMYDALRSARPYKPAFSREKSREIIKSQAGSHLDPELIAHFESVEDAFEEVIERLQPEPTGHE